MSGVRRILLLLVMICPALQSQMKYNNQIEPGVSTQADVEKALGAPLRMVNPGVFEYAPAAGGSKLTVHFRHGGVVELVRAELGKPYPRVSIIQALKLTGPPETNKMIEGHLVEYFGAPALIALTYASDNSSSGVSQITYGSAVWYAVAMRVAGQQAPRRK